MSLTKEEWVALKNDELVRKLFHTLEEERSLRKEAWSEDMFGDKRENDIQIGFVQCLKWVINGGFMPEEDLIEEDKEEVDGEY